MAFYVSINDKAREVYSATRQSTRTLDDTTTSTPSGQAEAYSSIGNLDAISTTISKYAGYMSEAKDAYLILTDASQGLTEIQARLGELRTIAVLGQNKSLATDTRTEWGATFTNYKNDILNTANETAFQESKLLDGSFVDQTYTTGPDTKDVLSITIASHTPYSLGIGDLNIDSVSSSSEALTKIDDALNTINTSLNNLGGIQSQLDNTLKENNIKMIKVSKTVFEDHNVTTTETKNTNLEIQNDRYKTIKLSTLEQYTTLFKVLSDGKHLKRHPDINPQELVVYLYTKNEPEDKQELSIKV